MKYLPPLPPSFPGAPAIPEEPKAPEVLPVTHEIEEVIEEGKVFLRLVQKGTAKNPPRWRP